MCWLCFPRLTMSSRVRVAPSFPRPPAMLTIFDGDRGGVVGCGASRLCVCLRACSGIFVETEQVHNGVSLVR